MEPSELSPIAGAPNMSSALYANAFERARAQEAMNQAVFLAELALAGAARVRNAMNSVGHAMSVAYGRNPFGSRL